jgi:hypothetical protein
MIAKFLMLAKSTDRMDALISQKPFWRMFGDPNAILAVQELAMTMLCDVVVELGKERQVPELAKQHSSSTHGDQRDKVRPTIGLRLSHLISTQLIWSCSPPIICSFSNPCHLHSSSTTTTFTNTGHCL